MKLLTKSSSGYQIMDRSRYTVTKYLNDENMHAAFNSELFMKLNHVNNAFYEIELAKATIEHKKPIFVWFLKFQYAKLRFLEFYYNFFTKFCDVNNLEELEMDADSLYLALSENELEDCIRQEMKPEWERLRSKDCTDIFISDAVASCLPKRCCNKHKKRNKRDSGLLEEDFRYT